MDTVKNFDAKVKNGRVTFDTKIGEAGNEVIVVTENKKDIDPDTDEVIIVPHVSEVSVEQIKTLLDAAIQNKNSIESQVAEIDERIAFLRDQLLPVVEPLAKKLADERKKEVAEAAEVKK